MNFVGSCYRAHDPRWAFKPLSGDGAALRGGRFNPVGYPALYLSLSIDGAVNEVAHGLPQRLNPLTVCVYDVDVDGVVDLRDDLSRALADVTLAELSGPWKLTSGLPPSWGLAKRMLALGAAGILVPSFARGAKPDHANLVLWTWGPDRPHKVTVHDPSGRLPKNQLSWT